MESLMIHGVALLVEWAVLAILKRTRPYIYLLIYQIYRKLFMDPAFTRFRSLGWNRALYYSRQQFANRFVEHMFPPKQEAWR